MKGYLLLLAGLFAAAVTARAQYTLEEIRIIDTTDTRVLDINDQGAVCGYAYEGTFERGFVLTGNGRLHRMEPPPSSGHTHSRVTCINSNDTFTAIVRTSNSTSLSADGSVYKTRYFPRGDSFSALVPVTFPISNPLPTKINNKNQLMGWYSQGPGVTTPRYFWILFDTTVAALPSGYSDPYYATRYSSGTNFYPTFSGGINENGKAAGYYYNTNDQKYYSYIFDVNAKAFESFTDFSRKVYDINDAQIVAGTLVYPGNDNRASIAEINGSLFQHIPVDIFSGPMQSEFTAVNNKNMIVGNYKHPVTGLWVGFIYRRGLPEYRLPGFDFSQHTWAMKNTSNYAIQPQPNDTIDIWTANFWGNFNYQQFDPASGDSIAVEKNTSLESMNVKLASFTSPSWLGFCKENAYYNNNADDYQTIRKSLLMEKYLNKFERSIHTIGDSITFSKFTGYCYGFSYAALQKLYDPAAYYSWFNGTSNSDASGFSNNAFDEILSIERSYLKQLDSDILQEYIVKNYEKLQVSRGLFQFKNEFMKPQDEVNPKPITFYIQELSGVGGYHSVLPYKIKTPDKLPIDGYDTMFVYDSHFPMDSTQYLLVKSNLSFYDNTHDSVYSSEYYKVKFLNFYQPGVKDSLAHRQFSRLKPTDDLLYADSRTHSLGIGNNSNTYVIYDENNNEASLVNGLYKDSIDNFEAVIAYDRTEPPFSFFSDTSVAIRFFTGDYSSSPAFMNWSITNSTYALYINRIVTDSAETDHGAISNKLIAYKNNDANAKKLNLGYVQMDPETIWGVNYRIKNFIANQNDSLVTSSPEDYQYKIQRIGGDSATYDIVLFIMDNGELRTLETTLAIEGGSTHVYDPYFDGPNGRQLVVYVDNGNDGGYNDTLFLDPVGISEFKNVKYISVYPNPVADELSVQISDRQSDRYQLVITDLLGKTVLNTPLKRSNGNISKINTAMLRPAIYHITIAQNDEIVFRKKIVKR